MAYTPPTWTNNAPPALNAANLNALSRAVADMQQVAQVGAVTLPASPVQGQMVTVIANPLTTWPGGISWDEGGPPVTTAGRRVVGLWYDGAGWVGTYSPLIPGLSYSTLAEAILSLSPVAYWKLDETSGTTATDSSGNGHHGTYTGTVTLNNRDGAPTFGGGYVTIPDSSAFTIGATGLTVFAIGYVTADSADSQFMVAKGTVDQYEWGMGVNWPTEGRTSYALWYTPAGFNYQYEMTADAHPKNVWSALAFTIGSPSTSGARFPLYRDSGDVKVTTQYDIAAGTPANGTAPLTLASRSGVGGLVGSLRHVAVYDKILTPSQMGELMAVARNEGLIP